MSGDNSAYMGLQTDGQRFDETVGDMAIFSGFGANDARGTSCRRLNEAGQSIYSCRLAYPLRASQWYRYRIWRLDATAEGQWWGAWIRDESTGVETEIGRMLMPVVSSTISSTASFTENFGPNVACNEAQRSIAIFTQPAANQTSPGAYEHYSSLGSTAEGGCGGSVTATDLGWTQGARIVQ